MTKRQKRKLLQLLILFIISGIGYFLSKQPVPPDVLGTISPGYYRVMEFSDGDTISVIMGDKTERIRMIGVDTPETHDPRKPVQCFGAAASNFTRNLIGNQAVRLESDELSQNRDRYDRLLRYVYLPDGKLVQAEIIREGYGFAYTSFPFTKSDEFRQLEQAARDQSKGLWAGCQPILSEHGSFISNPE